MFFTIPLIFHDWSFHPLTTSRTIKEQFLLNRRDTAVQDDLRGFGRRSPAPNNPAMPLPVVEKTSESMTFHSSREPNEKTITTAGSLAGAKIHVGVIDEYPFTRECIC